jgi:SAM-dependent methyltransferase
VEVLGSDLLERNLAVAEGAVYSPRAVRPSGPVLHPTFVEATGSSPGNHLTVRPAVREAVQFLPHNLLEPLPAPQAAPQGRGFDIILCRNVLVYFHPEAVRLVARHLVEALKPGGLLVTGTMDFVSAPAGTQLVGPPELQVFRRIEPAPEARVVARPERSTSPVSAPPGPVPPAATPETAPEPIALHVRALTHVELGEHKEAESLLTELQRHAPEYVPGVMEQALFCVRRGDHARAVALMREVLRRVEGLPADDIVDGPEPLTARFYQDSVRAFLERHGEE